jgi:hypothetical protein
MRLMASELGRFPENSEQEVLDPSIPLRAGGEVGKWERFERLEGFEKWEK